MTRIEQFNKARDVAQRCARAVASALGRDTPNNDKHRARCECHGLANGDWTPIKLSVHLSYGYYGSSSGYSATSVELGDFLAQAINESMTSLLERAVELAWADAEIKRLAAEDEAKAVLAQTAP